MKAIIKFEVKDLDDDDIKDIPVEELSYALKRVIDGWSNALSGSIIVKSVDKVDENVNEEAEPVIIRGHPTGWYYKENRSWRNKSGDLIKGYWVGPMSSEKLSKEMAIQLIPDNQKEIELIEVRVVKRIVEKVK